MELACPQCGETNRDDSIDFPFCTHCHEPLVKCGYCANFDSARGICRDPRLKGRKVSSDDQPDCGRYRTILATTVAFTQRVISPAKWVLMVAGTLFVLIVIGMLTVGQNGQNRADAGTPASIGVVAGWAADPPIVAGRPFKLEFQVTNPDANSASGPIRISIPAAFLDSFELRSIDPPPTAEPREGGAEPKPGHPDKRYWHYYDFPSVPPQGQRAITFELQTKPGFETTGFPFQEDPDGLDPSFKYSYDLDGGDNGDGLQGLGVHVYASNRKTFFSAPRILEIQTTH
jgi:hypothetical protein